MNRSKNPNWCKETRSESLNLSSTTSSTSASRGLRDSSLNNGQAECMLKSELSFDFDAEDFEYDRSVFSASELQFDSQSHASNSTPGDSLYETVGSYSSDNRQSRDSSVCTNDAADSLGSRRSLMMCELAVHVLQESDCEVLSETLSGKFYLVLSANYIMQFRRAKLVLADHIIFLLYCTLIFLCATNIFNIFVSSEFRTRSTSGSLFWASSRSALQTNAAHVFGMRARVRR